MNNIDQFASEKLGDIIVMHRYLGLYPQLSTAAMKELAGRREKGDIFNYEEYINTKLDALPKIKLEIPSTNILMEQIKRLV